VAAAPAVAHRASGAHAVAAAARSSADWKPTILVCDDSPDIRQLLSVVLDRAGADVLLAPTGEDAVTMPAARRPDAVLLDLDLPGMSGLVVADRLRTLGYDGPIIAVTGGGDDLSASSLRDQGFTDIVHKPTPGSVIVDMLASHLPAWTPRRHRTGVATR
jgi:DNA-binding response OmpR family regulator